MSSCRTHARERQRAFAFCSLHLAAERRVACLLSENTRVLSLRRLLRQAKRQLRFCIKNAADIVWTHWGLNPGPSACKADVIPLHHVPICGSNPDACAAIGNLPSRRWSRRQDNNLHCGLRTSGCYPGRVASSPAVEIESAFSSLWPPLMSRCHSARHTQDTPRRGRD